jgi:hypothetical protein
MFMMRFVLDNPAQAAELLVAGQTIDLHPLTVAHGPKKLPVEVEANR